ncbi:MAG: hypothetical protein V4631_18260 [Pseudomonadota bacterium]
MDENTEQRGIVGLETSGSKEDALAERKARLLRQAEFYRVGIVHARAGVKQGARPEALFHQAIDHASWALRSRVDGLLRPTGINVGAIMPFAVSILGFITRRRLVKPALGVLAVAAAVGLYVQQRRGRALF